MQQKPKIAVIGLKGLPAYGGAATVGENIINELKAEYTFTVYLISSHTEKKTSEDEGVKFIVFSKIPFKRINILYYYILSTFHSLLFANFDLVHLHHRDAAFLIPLLKLRYKIVLTTHGIFTNTDKWEKYNWYFRLQERYFVKFADKITCVSKKEQHLFKEILGISVNYIPNGVNQFAFESIQPIEKKQYIFFAASRIIRSKGLNIVLEALHKIHYQGELIVAGDLTQDFNYKNEILNNIKNLRVRFLGLVKDKNNLLRYIAESKMFIFPSITEAMSMMILEAASVKAIILCSDISENKDIFSENEVLFFGSQDSTDLALKIDFSLKNYGRLLKLSENAFKKVISNYPWQNIAQQYSIIFKSLLVSKVN